MPTAYVTGNPVECVIHPEIWNKSKIWDPQAVGQIYEDQYEEEYVGYPIESVSTTYINIIIVVGIKQQSYHSSQFQSMC